MMVAGCQQVVEWKGEEEGEEKEGEWKKDRTQQTEAVESHSEL